MKIKNDPLVRSDDLTVHIRGLTLVTTYVPKTQNILTSLSQFGNKQ